MSDPGVAAVRKPGLQPVCFVLMPYGTKDAPLLGKVHFDDVYAQVIAPAIADAGMQCIRADEELVGGIIHKPMYERLLLCEYAVADLSMANANVYYELGSGTPRGPGAPCSCSRKAFALPFDVRPLRAVPYQLVGGRPDTRPRRRRPGRARRPATHSHTPATDSPVFQLLPA